MEILNREQMDNKLLELYREWVKNANVDFYPRMKDVVYSNPYLCGIPDNWCTSNIRLMICGREGNGEISKNEEAKPIEFPGADASDDKLDEYIKELQKNNLGFVSGDRKTFWIDSHPDNIVEGTWSFFEDNHAFARTFKRFIKELGVPVIWNECDKICHVNHDGYNKTNALKTNENTILHTIDGKDILKEEIAILRPTHIIFLGYWRQSLMIDKKNRNNVDLDGNSVEYPFLFPSDDNYDNAIRNHIRLDNSKDGKIIVYYLSHPQFKNEEYQKVIDDIIVQIKNDIDQIKCFFLEDSNR